ncbi:MAG TPA: class I SAM-dependent methyltransferase [Candidatus Thermoplasmatota archaeon]|nr:class I SAM-dependent methyltransferase [Candidatus Thermoplasmatota archaeon]
MARPAYGIDAPIVVRNLALFGLAGITLGTASLLLASGWWRIALANYGFWAGGSLLLTSGAMVASSLHGKPRLRDHLLAALDLRGGERLLDVGCGRGLLLIGAAKRLARGQAVGIDLWSRVDQSGNSPEATMENARREGVVDRIKIHTGDMRDMPFPDGAFDAVVSNLALHNLPQAARPQALAEIARVTRQGGLVALADFRDTKAHAAGLLGSGFTEVRRSRPVAWTFPPVRIVTARKPGRP